MGFYLNSNKPVTLYANEIKRPYFVDKTDMLKELIPLVEVGTQYICITRPRRFGKTIMANTAGIHYPPLNFSPIPADIYPVVYYPPQTGSGTDQT